MFGDVGEELVDEPERAPAGSAGEAGYRPCRQRWCLPEVDEIGQVLVRLVSWPHRCVDRPAPPAGPESGGRPPGAVRQLDRRGRRVARVADRCEARAERWALKSIGRRSLSAGRSTAGKIGVLGQLLTAFEMAKNPWHVARIRAEMTGAVLADLISRTEGERFVLIGHSLGARVMMSTARVLATKADEPRLAEVHLLGAAVNSRLDLRGLEAAIEGGMIHNYWSRNDTILRGLYRSAEFGTRAAGAVGFSHRSPVVKNHNVSRRVSGHSAFTTEVQLVRSASDS